MAVFATVLCDPAFLIRLLPMRAFLPAAVEVRMASLAGLGANILCLFRVLWSRNDRGRFRVGLRGLSLLRTYGSMLQAKQTDGDNNHRA